MQTPKDDPQAALFHKRIPEECVSFRTLNPPLPLLFQHSTSHFFPLSVKRPPTKRLTNSLWHSMYANDKFRIKIERAENVVTGKLFGVGVTAALYLGDNPVCGEEKTRLIPPTSKPEWGQALELDLCLKDVPRNARLCLALYGVWANPIKVKKSKKNFRNDFPLAWVNISVMDFLGTMRMGRVALNVSDGKRPEWGGGREDAAGWAAHLFTSTFQMWKYEDEEEAKLINPLGTTTLNTNNEACPVLHFSFSDVS